MFFSALHEVAGKLWMSGADDFAGARWASLVRKVEWAQLLFTPDTVKVSFSNGLQPASALRANTDHLCTPSKKLRFRMMLSDTNDPTRAAQEHHPHARGD